MTRRTHRPRTAWAGRSSYGRSKVLAVGAMESFEHAPVYFMISFAILDTHTKRGGVIQIDFDRPWLQGVPVSRAASGGAD